MHVSCAAEWVAALQEHIGQDSPLKPMILNHVHSSPLAGHSSYLKSLHRAKQNFYWEDMKKDLNRQSTSAKSVIGSKLRPLLPLDYHSPCLFQLGLGQISAWISLMDYQSHRIICCSCGSWQTHQVFALHFLRTSIFCSLSSVSIHAAFVQLACCAIHNCEWQGCSVHNSILGWVF